MRDCGRGETFSFCAQVQKHDNVPLVRIGYDYDAERWNGHCYLGDKCCSFTDFRMMYEDDVHPRPGRCLRRTGSLTICVNSYIPIQRGRISPTTPIQKGNNRKRSPQVHDFMNQPFPSKSNCETKSDDDEQTLIVTLICVGNSK